MAERAAAGSEVSTRSVGAVPQRATLAISTQKRSAAADYIRENSRQELALHTGVASFFFVSLTYLLCPQQRPGSNIDRTTPIGHGQHCRQHYEQRGRKDLKDQVKELEGKIQSRFAGPSILGANRGVVAGKRGHGGVGKMLVVSDSVPEH